MPVLVPAISGVASPVLMLAPPVMSTVPRVSICSSEWLTSSGEVRPPRVTLAVTS